MSNDDEIYECAGCGGEIAIVEAVWLPEKSLEKPSKPYCCEECYRINNHEQ